MALQAEDREGVLHYNNNHERNVYLLANRLIKLPRPFNSLLNQTSISNPGAWGHFHFKFQPIYTSPTLALAFPLHNFFGYSMSKSFIYYSII